MAIFLPLLTGLAALPMPRRRPDIVRFIAPAGSVLTLFVALVMWAGPAPGASALQWRTTLLWIPAIGARYDVAIGGLSGAPIVLTALLLTVVATFSLRETDRANAHAFLFLLLGTGLIGRFAAQDLLLLSCCPCCRRPSRGSAGCWWRSR